MSRPCSSSTAETVSPITSVWAAVLVLPVQGDAGAAIAEVAGQGLGERALDDHVVVHVPIPCGCVSGESALAVGAELLDLEAAEFKTHGSPPLLIASHCARKAASYW